MNQVTNIKNIGIGRINNKKMTFIIKEKNATNMEKYIDDIFDEETIEKLLKSEADIEAGRTRKAEDVLNELKEKFEF